LDLALLIDARDFDALSRVRSYRGSRANIDGGTGYLAGVVDRYAHPDQQNHSEDQLPEHKVRHSLRLFSHDLLSHQNLCIGVILRVLRTAL
jgi:hypothetical protein